MPVTQAEIAKKWNVSKGLVSRYVARGMPTTSIPAAEFWARQHVYRRKLQFPTERSAEPPLAAKPPPASKRDPREGDPNWRLTVKETFDVVRTLYAMKAEGYHRKNHPEHLAFCQGVTIACDRGVSLTAQQWKRARGES